MGDFNSTMMSQISSYDNPYKELIEDAQISGLGFEGKLRHALAIDPQEVTEDILLKHEISKDKPCSFRSLRELTLRSDFRVHPPACHQQFLTALKAEKKTSILENKELGPPVAKSAYLTEKIKKKESRAKNDTCFPVRLTLQSNQ